MTREEFISMIDGFDYSDIQRQKVIDWFDHCKGKGGKQEVIRCADPQRIWTNASRWSGRVRKEEKTMKILENEAPEKAFHIFVAEIKKITNMKYIDATQGMIFALQQELDKQREKLKENHINDLQQQMLFIQEELKKYGVTK